MRKLLLSLLMLALPMGLYAQSTTVSGTVTDAGGQTWNNGTVVAKFVPPPQTPVGPWTWTGGTFGQAQTTVNGTLDGVGHYSISVPSNTAISPTGSQWTITVFSATQPQATSVQQLIITGGTQTVNFTPPAIKADAGVNSPVTAYADAEVSAGVGQFYWNLGMQLFRVCTVSTNAVCSTWINIGGSGPGGLPRLDQVLDQNQNKLFNQGGGTIGFTNGPGLGLGGETTPMTIPMIAGCTPTTTGAFCYDSTNNNYIIYNGTSNVVASFPNTVQSGHVAGFLLTGGALTLQDLGPLNATSGNSILNVFLTNVQEGDSICYDAPTSRFVNCTEGVPINVQAGASYAIASTDRGTYVDMTDNVTTAVTLPQASSATLFSANFFTFVKADSANSVITPTTSNISYHGRTQTTINMAIGEGCSILSDPAANSGNGTYYPRCSPTQDPEGDPMLVPFGVDVNTTGWYSWEIANNGVTGTVLNKAACSDAAGKAIICSHTTSTTNNALGIAVGGDGVAPGTTGSTGICSLGFCKIIMDNSATAGHYAQESPTVDGDFTDVGSTQPANSQDFYYIVTGNSGAGTAAVIRILAPQELTAAQINGGGKSSIEINGAGTQPIVNFATGGGVTWSQVKSGNTSTITATVASSGYNTIDNAGVSLTQRSTLNFIASGGATIACVDNSGATRTDCTVSAGSGYNTPTAITNISSVNYTIQNGDNGAWLQATGGNSITLPQANQISSAPFVSNLTNGRTTCTTCTTASFSPTAGDTIFLVISQDSTSNTTSAVTDGINTWTQVGGACQNTTSKPMCVFVASNVSGSAITPSWTWNGSSIDTFWNVVQYNSATILDASGVGNANPNFAQATAAARYPSEVAVAAMTSLSGCPTGYNSRDTGQITSQVKICDNVFNGVTSITTTNPGTGQIQAVILQTAGTTATATFVAGWSTTIQNIGPNGQANPLTVTPTTSTINGQTKLIIWPNQECHIASDGVNYSAQCGFLPNRGAVPASNGTTGGSITIDAQTQGAGHASIGTTILTVTPSSPISTYMMAGYADLTVIGTSCSGNTTVAFNAVFTDPQAAGTTTLTLGTWTITTNGAVGQNFSFPPIYFQAKGSTNISFSTTYTAGGSCSPAPTVAVTPILQVL